MSETTTAPDIDGNEDDEKDAPPKTRTIIFGVPSALSA